MNSYRENVEKKRGIEETLRQEEKESKIHYQKFDADEIGIILMGDEHDDAAQYDRDFHMAVLESAYDHGHYMIHMGDAMETATRHSVGSGVYDQNTIVDRQIENVIAKYQPFVDAGLMIGMHPGNHEMRVFKDDGFNLTRHVCRRMKTRYFGFGKISIFRVGNQTYTFYSTHGSSGAQKIQTKIKAAMDLEQIVEVDVYAHGHLHELASQVAERHVIDLRSKKLMKKERYYVLTGHYLKYWGSYAQARSMKPSRIGSPVIYLSGNRHKIKVKLQ